jgi:hypothetical protein
MTLIKKEQNGILIRKEKNEAIRAPSISQRKF